jgi:hypothetical protein
MDLLLFFDQYVSSIRMPHVIQPENWNRVSKNRENTCKNKLSLIYLEVFFLLKVTNYHKNISFGFT